MYKQNISIRDFYQVQLSPTLLEFGHVKETPDDWEQRYERKNMAENRHQGKVKNNFYLVFQ